MQVGRLSGSFWHSPSGPGECRYPTTVATLSRRCKDNIAAAFERSVDGGAASPLLNSRLHDFGFRWAAAAFGVAPTPALVLSCLSSQGAFACFVLGHGACLFRPATLNLSPAFPVSLAAGAAPAWSRACWAAWRTC